MEIFDRISSQLVDWRERITRLKENHGSFKVSEITVEQLYGGIRGVPTSVSDISYVDAHEGIRLRGYTIPEIINLLPRMDGAEIPLVGGLYHLLMANEIPTLKDALDVEKEWQQRNRVPDYVFDVLRRLPADTHPMTMFSMAILALQSESVFAKRYAEGLAKSDFWKYYLEDSLNLTARLPVIGAFIYNLKFRQGQFISPDPSLDWGANFAHMIGKGEDKEYHDLVRLFFILHSDHESGNVSAHTSHLVGSALSDVYYACSAGINGLAGPLHGLANQECLKWLLELQAAFPDLPTRPQLEKYLSNYLDTGRVIPGYGHAVLRVTDPRFTAQLEFGKQHMPDDELFKLVSLVYECLPPILAKQGKVKNPLPNVDAINGTMQFHYGVREFEFYTVLFGIGRTLGLTSHAVWARALGKPIERPKSLTTRMLEEMVSAS
ncbi:MAG TPA: type I citrate synthase [Anaerolineaceae bacterium]|nr:MAG: type I citrate synthase [Chloroflexi bacterium GWB2_54_36]HAL18004.1 type I citrate synthase [Anaerolineaceae bacterium]HBA90387.1 type I citrate synthase [Anaerolineaceae bacterium]